MILEPNASFAGRFEYDMSGIRLRADGADFKILRVSRVVENFSGDLCWGARRRCGLSNRWQARGGVFALAD